MEKTIEKIIENIVPWLINHGLKIIIIGIIAYILIRVLKAFIDKAVRLAVVQEPGTSKESEKKREDTLIQIFATTSRIIILIISMLMILQEIGIQIAPILAGAGIVGLAVGFGGQYLIRDIISGLFIILENQFRMGDVVRINDTAGLVEDITLRKTTLRDIDGIVHHIPHGEITKVSNLSKGFARVNLNVGIGYGSNIEKVIEVVNRIGNQMAEEPEWKESILKAPQFLRVDDLADSSVIIKILGDTVPHKQWDIMGELRKRILIEFNKAGIEIPFPQVVVTHPKV